MNSTVQIINNRHGVLVIEYLYIFIVKICNVNEDDYEMDLAESPLCLCFT